MQLELFRHGGKRTGAGRKNRSGLQAHVKRESLNPRYPVHVTLRLAPGLPSFRKKESFKILKEAVKKARKQGLAVAHYAILSNHLHLILEPKSPRLTKVFQSLCISFAKRLNRELKRKGEVFLGRYHLHVLKTPSEVKRALLYVLANESRHRGRKPEIDLGPYTSALSFPDWKLLIGKFTTRHTLWADQVIEAWHSQILVPPKTWLLATGWKRAV